MIVLLEDKAKDMFFSSNFDIFHSDILNLGVSLIYGYW